MSKHGGDISPPSPSGFTPLYNTTKPFSLCFKPTRIKIKPPNFALGIPSVDPFKYLGIIISVKNNDADLKRQTRKYFANANMLLRKFSHE